MEFKPTVHFRPESETEISIWWDFDSELAEIIPANYEAIMEWIVSECAGEEIEGGYFMECDSSALDGAGHESLGRMVAKVGPWRQGRRGLQSSSYGCLLG